ncbi:MAG: type III PLP-dependent enzyme [Pseudobdellovibrionaceae bacterium]|jgi:ornithine decarboxylase|nr:type III PLP-dependent enzyme [Pseudobdellovibrionaceae bacterium]
MNDFGVLGSVLGSSLSPYSQQEHIFHQIRDLVLAHRPVHPLHILRKPALTNQAKRFIDGFSGTVMFAVKSNPHEDVIRTLISAGVTCFDAASIEEVRLIRRISQDVRIHFMHTVKTREAIREAYFDHQVRAFVIDTLDELHKILHETELASDLTIFVRLALPKNKDATVDFSVKFGATPKGAALLLHEARLVCPRLGIMFHPGTQSSNPEIFLKGLSVVADVVKRARVKVDCLDVGGGFPAPYPHKIIPDLSLFFQFIHDGVTAHGFEELDLYCEPGRALVAEAGLLVARVELRKDKTLYLNDGVYGGLIEAAKWAGEFVFPVMCIPQDGTDVPKDAELIPFRFCGPTCDSLDMMKGPFFLPEHIQEGDWILIGMNGAYSNACRTNFNGFGQHKFISVDF